MERRSKPRRRRGRGLLFLLVFTALTGLYVRWDNTALQVSSFSAVLRDLPPGFDGCRAVVLGDLHSTWFGGKNGKLLEAVKAQEPEYIFLVGDLLDAFRDVPEGYAEETAAGLAGTWAARIFPAPLDTIIKNSRRRHNENRETEGCTDRNRDGRHELCLLSVKPEYL